MTLSRHRKRTMSRTSSVSHEALALALCIAHAKGEVHRAWNDDARRRSAQLWELGLQRRFCEMTGETFSDFVHRHVEKGLRYDELLRRIERRVFVRCAAR